MSMTGTARHLLNVAATPQVHAMDADAAPLCEYLGTELDGVVRCSPQDHCVTCVDCQHLLLLRFDEAGDRDTVLQQCCPTPQVAAARLCGCGGMPYV